jgi:hypothetical protein
LASLVGGVILLHLGFDLILGSFVSNSKSLDIIEYTCMMILTLSVAAYGFDVGKPLHDVNVDGKRD